MIIAEIGHNHNGSIRLAKLMIEEAKNCGADAVKFQLYDTDLIKRPWQWRYYELMAAELCRDDVHQLADQALKSDIELLFSCFDPERVDWAEEVGVIRHKVASRSIYDKNLWERLLETGKPIIASLGAWRGDDLPPFDADYLYCVSEYPAYIRELPNFDKYAGFSDHTIGCYWAREAIKRGARIIEKHFTLSKKLPGHNQKGSADPQELKDFVVYARQHERGINF